MLTMMQRLFQNSGFKYRTCAGTVVCLSVLAIISYLISENHRLQREHSRILATQSRNELPRHLVQHKAIYTAQGLELYVHTAFLDTRFNARIIRIFGLQKGVGAHANFTCKWGVVDEREKYAFLHTVATHYWLDKTTFHYSTFFACEFDCLIPDGVESDLVILESNRGHTYDVKIERTIPAASREDVAACIPPMTNFQRTAWIAEWIETMKITGLRNMIIYDGDVSGPGKHLLEYYSLTGDIIRFPFPFLLGAIQKAERTSPTPEELFAIYGQINLLALHDCVYRFHNQYRYLAMLNIGDIIVSDDRKPIEDIIRGAELRFPKSSAFTFNVSWHWEDFGAIDKSLGDNEATLFIPKYPVGTVPNGVQTRPIISTDRVISINFFNVLQVPSSDYVSVALPEQDYGSVHHFRGKCKDKFNGNICKDMLNSPKNFDDLFGPMEKPVEKELKRILAHLQL